MEQLLTHSWTGRDPLGQGLSLPEVDRTSLPLTKNKILAIKRACGFRKARMGKKDRKS